MKKVISLFAILVAVANGGHAEELGSVDTAFQLLGPNHKIVVEVFDDPAIQGVSCDISRAKAGGLGAAVGFSTDTSDASIACRQLGPISFNGKVPQQAEVFTEKTSPVFKHFRVVRIVDKRRNTLVYLTYSDKLVDGSPKNSISTVPVDRSIPIPVQQ